MTIKWKVEDCRTCENWKDKTVEYTVMAKIMNCINRSPIKEFEKKWKTYHTYYKDRREKKEYNLL